MVKRAALLGGILILSAVGAPAAFAEEVTFEFTGTVSSATGVFLEQDGADAPTVVSGVFTYDSDLVDAYPTQDNRNSYSSDAPAENEAFNDAWGITVTFGIVTQSTTNNARAVGQLHHRLDLGDATGTDSFRMLAIRRAASDDLATLALMDQRDGADPDGVAEGSGNLTDWDLSTPLDPSRFSVTTSQSMYFAYSDTGALLGALRFALTTIAVPTVEDDPIALLYDLVDNTMDLDLPRRTERRLLRKLGGALDKLEDGKECNDGAATWKLVTYIFQVKILGCREKIDEADAEDLISQAVVIVELLWEPGSKVRRRCRRAHRARH